MGCSRTRRRGRLCVAAGLAVVVAALAPTSVSAAAIGRAKGLDVSNWNGTITWSKVAAAGYRFAFGKATEGTSYTDATYATNRNGSETAGLVFGAYHFARPAGASLAAATASAIAQADHFLAVAAPQPGELPPVLDLETTGNLPAARLLVWTLAWIGEVEARTGVLPFVYTSPNFWKARLGDSTAAAVGGAGLWIAHWTSASQPLVPAQNWAGSGWSFWQWTNCVSVSGMKHCADGDWMNGANPTSVTIDPYPAGAPLLSTPPSIVGQPEAGRLLAAVPGTWVGGKPLQFSYQWKRCDAAGAQCAVIPGAVREKYAPVSDDVGHALTVVATASSATAAASATAPPTAVVSAAGTAPSALPANVAPPQILGRPQVGQVLTTSTGTWTGSPKTFAYRWRRCDSAGFACVAIKHAVQAHYTLTPDDIGSTISLVVTATGAGGSTSATATPTKGIVAAPLPPVSLGTQTVQRGVAGNLETDDGRATVTWQPGAVPVGKTVTLGTFTGSLSIPGTEVSLTVPGLSSRGFKWPLDLSYARAQPAKTVLGYSTDGRVYHTAPNLQPPELPPGTAVGTTVDANGLTHVLTRTPLQLALFRKGAWGDPTYTSATGPALPKNARLHVVPHPADHSVLLITRLSAQSQARLSATVTGGGERIPILGRGSRLGGALPAGHFEVAKTLRQRPGSIPVRLRLGARQLQPGVYRLRIYAIDPWRRHGAVTLRFRYR